MDSLLWILRRCAFGTLLPALALLGPGTIRAADKPDPAAAEFFEKEIRPLLTERCFKCHGGEKTRGSLKLTSRATLVQGGDSGPAAVPGDPDKSLFIQAVRHDGLKMPPKEKLKDQDVEKLTRWVKLGLPWPETGAAAVAVRTDQEYQISEAQRRFWSFQPLQAVPPPAVKDGTWPRSGIDRFILAALEAHGVGPTKPADKRTLIRRATFDLTGLPPTPQEIDAFLADDSPEAFARVVDRLLASPHYGERWGRHWLDVVRYTDSFDARIVKGDGNTMDIPASYRYRDWVVDALNRDLPYDQFIINQIGGDLLPGPEPGAMNVPGTIATGMLAIGNWGGGDADKEKLLTDIADDQVDVVSRAFLGLTVACARCHDHPFDPIPTDDYYSLAGIFFSSHILQDPGPKTNGPPMLRIPLLTAEEKSKRDQYAARVAELEKEIKQLRDVQQGAVAKVLLPQTGRYLTAAWEYRQHTADPAAPSLTGFAKERQLDVEVLRHWIAYLGMGEFRLLNKPVSNAQGNAGLYVWQGEKPALSLTVNTTDKEIAFLTIKLPPRSVAVHPSPTGGVGVAWKSPISGPVRITGRVADADPVCGDGIEWVVQQRTLAGNRELASGAIPNGGAQKLSEGKNAAGLETVTVREGETVVLVVLPKKEYSCDTTVIELEISELEGAKKVWNLTADLLPDPFDGGGGNPHRDSHGNRDVWHFCDMAEDQPGSGGATASSALARWRTAVEQVAGGKAERNAINKAAMEVQEALQSADVLKSPDVKLYQDLTAPGSPFLPRALEEQVLPAEERQKLGRLTTEVDALKKNPPPPLPFAHGVQEGGCPQSPQVGTHDVRVHIRGRYDRLGKLVPRCFPRIIAGENQQPITEGSGRLQLARWVASADNPLTPRVIVNRVWQQHFGEGLVRTPGNFGKQGEPPTNPELLDHLARVLIDSGWSLKTLHRTIMLSAVYQQGSSADEATLKADPDNRMFSRMNRRRLEAEAIRDSLLAVSGKLDRTRGGPASQDFNLPGRTLYLMTIRSDRTSFRELFDAADPTAIIDKRAVSTVAPQALFLLNHPFAVEQTGVLAKRIVREGPADEQGKIERLYVLLFGRRPGEQEVKIGRTLLAGARQHGAADEAAWERYGQVLLCTNEFVYVD
jgi:hypothetical protein